MAKDALLGLDRIEALADPELRLAAMIGLLRSLSSGIDEAALAAFMTVGDLAAEAAAEALHATTCDPARTRLVTPGAKKHLRGGPASLAAWRALTALLENPTVVEARILAGASSRMRDAEDGPARRIFSGRDSAAANTVAFRKLEAACLTLAKLRDDLAALVSTLP